MFVCLGFGVLVLWFGGVVVGLVGCTYTHLLKIYSLNSLWCYFQKGANLTLAPGCYWNREDNFIFQTIDVLFAVNYWHLTWHFTAFCWIELKWYITNMIVLHDIKKRAFNISYVILYITSYVYVYIYVWFILVILVVLSFLKYFYNSLFSRSPAAYNKTVKWHGRWIDYRNRCAILPSG